MKKYMVVIDGEEGTAAVFTDDAEKAEQTRMDAECGMGCRAQLYKWYPRSGQYKLLYE